MPDLLTVLPGGPPGTRVEAPELPPENLRALYRGMLRIRVLDARMLGLQRQGRIGFYGTATGEEAAVVGSAAALRPADWIFPALRQGGAMLLRGMPVAQVIAQCMGNSADVLKGRMQPVHMADRRVNVVSWSSCIGTQLPHAVGAARAAQILGHDTVVMGYLGDGATSEADFHVAMNFAGVWKAPVVLLCQNNQWAISVPFRVQTAAESIAVKAEAYGFPGVRVDGNDVLAVHRVCGEAVARARAGGGPTLVECLTYRMLGHSSSDDPTRYRAEAEVEEWRRRDPIERFRRHLEERRLWSAEEDDRTRAEFEEEIRLAALENERTKPPTLGSMVEDVYKEVPWHLREELGEIETGGL
ncbi:MAG: thiamine pyrophosphate-dependent enzyme [Planctomycetales bacterium]|nr:thiamine pyrophosphate-dependent enzyme [Planctomycetales bacterium]